MSDYVINYGKPNQFRASLSIIDLSDDDGTRYVATMYRVGTDEILSRFSCPSAGAAHGAVLDDMKRAFDTVEFYQRAKHHDLSMKKVLKKMTTPKRKPGRPAKPRHQPKTRPRAMVDSVKFEICIERASLAILDAKAEARNMTRAGLVREMIEHIQPS